MATLKPMVRAHQRRSDGTWFVKIRLTHRRQVRWIPTNIVARQEDLTRSLNFRPGPVALKAAQLVAEMQRVLSDLSPFASEAMDVDEVLRYLKAEMGARDFRLNIFDHLETYLAWQKRSEGTQKNYREAFNALERFLGGRSLDVNDITAAMLREFVEFLNAEPKMRYGGHGVVQSGTPKKRGLSASKYLAHISTVFRDAKARYNDEDAGVLVIPRDPFSRVRVEKDLRGGQKPLPVEVVQAMIDDADGGRLLTLEQLALDTFLLSFGLMGINVADLYELPQQEGEWLTYHRKKTRDRRPDRAEVRVLIRGELSDIIGRLKDGTGRRWLRLYLRYNSAETATCCLNKGLASWAKRRGVPVFTMYAARKTWATLARRSTDKGTVDEALGHVGDFRLLDIYAERDWSLAAAANARVFLLFRWPTTG